MKTNLSKKIIQSIKEKNIKPKPRWSFLVYDILIWLSGALFLFIGSLATSVIIYIIRENDWEIYHNLFDSLGTFLVLSLPYTWFVLLLIFVFFIKMSIHRTRRGYKYEAKIIIGLTILASILFGGVLYNMGVGYRIDQILTNQMPSLNRFMNHHIDRWSRPGKGFLAGVVIDRKSNQEFDIEDYYKKQWEIIASNDQARNPIQITIGKKVRLIGEELDDDHFMAWKIIIPRHELCPFRDSDEVVCELHSDVMGIERMKEKIRTLRINR